MTHHYANSQHDWTANHQMNRAERSIWHSKYNKIPINTEITHTKSPLEQILQYNPPIAIQSLSTSWLALMNWRSCSGFGAVHDLVLFYDIKP